MPSWLSCHSWLALPEYARSSTTGVSEPSVEAPIVATRFWFCAEAIA